jgi:hypothetical protein
LTLLASFLLALRRKSLISLISRGILEMKINSTGQYSDHLTYTRPSESCLSSPEYTLMQPRSSTHTIRMVQLPAAPSSRRTLTSLEITEVHKSATGWRWGQD